MQLYYLDPVFNVAMYFESDNYVKLYGAWSSFLELGQSRYKFISSSSSNNSSSSSSRSSSSSNHKAY